MSSKKIALLFASLFLGTFSVNMARAENSQLFTSFDVKEDSWYVYVGGVTGLTAPDLSKDNGFLLRASAGRGGYDYDTTGVAGGSVDGDVTAGDVMAGYQHYFSQDFRLTGYLGASLENQDLSPSDPNADVHGTEGGVKGQVEMLGRLAPRVPFQAIASYSTGFDTYWSSARVGYDLGGVVVGPEVGFQGNESYDEQRYGAALSDINLGGMADLKLSAGYADSDRDDESGYFNIGLVKNF